MSKENFYILLSRYRNGQCSAREKRLVEQWLMLLDHDLPSSAEGDSAALEEKLWIAIQAEKKSYSRGIYRAPAWKWVAAAVLAVSIGLWLIYPRPWTGENGIGNGYAVQSTGQLTKVSTEGEEKQLVLPDGSEIRLSPYSTLEYPGKFENREIYLEGKAFFNVTPDLNRPFLVYSGEIVTRVLGTSFWVDGSKPGNDVEVSVVTGKVSVTKRSEANEMRAGPVKTGAILTANQKVRFFNESKLFETGLVDHPVPLHPDDAQHIPVIRFEFDDTPIAEVVSALEQAYGIEIILANDALKKCLFRGDITEQPLFTKLDLLCASVGAEYEIRGTRVLVSGNGCSE